jgi:N-acetylglutamate synthase-like GNAT family acetyltransferase
MLHFPLLFALQELLHRYVAEQEHEAPHVYTFRREPKFFKLLEFSRIDVTGETKAAVEGAAAAKAAADDAAAAAAAAAPAKAVAGRSWWWPFG